MAGALARLAEVLELLAAAAAEQVALLVLPLARRQGDTGEEDQQHATEAERLHGTFSEV